MESWLEECYYKKTFLETPALQRCTLGPCVLWAGEAVFQQMAMAPVASPVRQGLVLHLAGFNRSPAESPGSMIRNTVPRWDSDLLLYNLGIISRIFSLDHCFSKSGSPRPLGVLKTLSWGLQDEDYFHNNTEMLFAFFTALIFVQNSGATATVSKTAGIQAWNQAVAPNYY